jgi:tRNA1Val (adenine37-N6)-methyltransferase
MSVFRFKHFSIDQSKVAMKVGTDGVLLGAWAEVSNKTSRILDVGAGSGLICLQMAQRYPTTRYWVLSETKVLHWLH